MTEPIAGYLVWTKGLKGFTAQKQPLGYERPRDEPEPVARIPLNAEQFSMRIAILEIRFPCPARLEDEVAG